MAGNNTVIKEQTVRSVTLQSTATSLPPVTVIGLNSLDDNDPYNADYNRTYAVTATKTDTSLVQMEIGRLLNLKAIRRVFLCSKYRWQRLSTQFLSR